MNRTKTLAVIAAAATLIAGCGDGEATPEQYEKARENYTAQVATVLGLDPAQATFTVTDAELDCISKATKVSIQDIADGEDQTTEEDTDSKNLRCLSSESMRTYFADSLTAGGMTEEAMASGGIDGDCVINVMTDQFETWKATDENALELRSRFTGPEFQELTADCVKAS